jgi:hypothetical protein
MMGLGHGVPGFQKIKVNRLAYKLKFDENCPKIDGWTFLCIYQCVKCLPILPPDPV